MTDATREVQCRRTVNDGKDRCPWRGSLGDFPEHTAETSAAGDAHQACIVCRRPLADDETQTCTKCIRRVEDDLGAIAFAYAHLHDHRRTSPNALAVISDGSTQGGGPDDDLRYKDPCSAAGQLERNERDWREEFGHGRPPYPPLGAPRRPLHVFAEALGYLKTWHILAARTHPAFDDFATEMRDLRSLLEHMLSMADDPRRAPIPCACGGKLFQHFGEDGLSDDRVCRNCGTRYKPAEYLWRYRMLTELQGWVSLERAATEAERPTATIWAWVCALDVPAACHRITKRVVVELAAVMERSEQTPRQRRRRSA